MVHYRRNYVAGGSYFFTLALRDRHNDLLVKHAELLKHAMSEVMDKHPFTIDAIVVMPEHLHTIWTLPENDANYSSRWRSIKSRFVRVLTSAGVSINRNHRGEADIWQRRFWEHTIRDIDDMNRHIDYIHYNPVKHGHVERPSDWPHSSIHRFIREGILSADWGANMHPDSPSFGKPDM